MNRQLKIGFLVPYSSIHPEMSQDVMDGFMTAIPDKFRHNYQFYPEFVNLGNDEEVSFAINKLIMFQHVDILSGFLSYKLLPVILPIVSNKSTLCFFLDMGEYLPPLQTLPSNIFFNSYQFWQLEYALGNWAQQSIGGKGATLMSTYDSGYHIHSSFWHGAIQAGAKEMDMHVLPYKPELKNIKPLLELFLKKIEKSEIDYLNALFCGNEALDFFDAFKKSGLHKKLPLLVSPHMASGEILSKIDNLGLQFYSASGWNYDKKSKDNQSFISLYTTLSGKKASVFALMGYEMGLAIHPVSGNLQKRDLLTAEKHLKTTTIEGPRGKRNFWLHNNDLKPDISIEKISSSSTKNTKIVIDQGKAMNYNHAVFEEIHKESVSGWRNPYLCI